MQLLSSNKSVEEENLEALGFEQIVPNTQDESRQMMMIETNEIGRLNSTGTLQEQQSPAEDVDHKWHPDLALIFPESPKGQNSQSLNSDIDEDNKDLERTQPHFILIHSTQVQEPGTGPPTEEIHLLVIDEDESFEQLFIQNLFLSE